MLSKHTVFGLIALFALSVAALAVPRVIQYQGKLTNLSGVGYNDTLDMSFRIFNTPTGGAALWTEAHTGTNDVPIVKGLFDVALGSITPINLDFHEDYWLEITVDGNILLPRVKLDSSPYAFRAAIADSVVGGAGGNTLGEAYNEGGPGAGYLINATSNPVDIRTEYVGPSDGTALEVRTNDDTDEALYVRNSGSGPAIFCSGDFKINSTDKYISNADITMQIDVNGGSTSQFKLQNDAGTDVLTVDESGNLFVMGEIDPTAVTFVPQATAPTATEGKVYARTDHNLYYYDGTSWVDLTATGGGAGQWDDAGIYKRVIGNDNVRAYESGQDYGYRYVGAVGGTVDIAGEFNTDWASGDAAVKYGIKAIGDAYSTANAYGVYAIGRNYDGGLTGGNKYGVYGTAEWGTNNYAIYGTITNGYGNGYAIYGDQGSGDYAGYFNGVAHVAPHAAPTTPVEGDIYANGTDHNLYYHDGTSWVDLTAGGGGGADADWAWASGSGLTGDIYHTGGIAVGLTTVPYQVSIADADTGGWLVLGKEGYNEDFSGLLAFDEDIDDGGICGFSFVHNGNENELYLTSGCMSAIWPHADTLMIFDRDLVKVEVATDLHVRGNLTVDGTYPGGGGAGRWEDMSGYDHSMVNNDVRVYDDGNTSYDFYVRQDATARYGIYGYDNSYTDGTEWSTYGSRAPICGYAFDGDAYNAGVAGWSYMDDSLSAGVIGGKQNGSVWGALGYNDVDENLYGGWFHGDVNIEGNLTVSGSFPGVDGSGTTNYIPLWTPDGSTLGNSRARQTADMIYVNSSPSMTSAFAVYCNSGGSGNEKNGIFGDNKYGESTAGTNWKYGSCGAGVFGLNEINAAYRAGVVGTAWGVYGDHTAGVVGSNSTGSVYGGLGYRMGGADYAGYFVGKVEIDNSTQAYSLEVNNTRASSSNRAIYASSDANADFQYGVYGKAHTPGSTSNYWAYGVYGYADVNDGTSSTDDAWGVRGQAYADDVAYGVYGYASSGATTYYGVYYSGGLGGTGTKSAIVRTEEGPKAVYCQESPENWFEDFGSGVVRGGHAHIDIAPDFLQTVTINEEHPMKLFIQMENTSVDYKLTKSDTGFDIDIIGTASEDVAFDYRVAAKRKGYEELRLKPAPHSYSDNFLYPSLADVPQEWRLDWIKNIPQDRWDVKWFNLLTPEQYQQASELYEQYKKDKPSENSAPVSSTSTENKDGRPIK